MYMSQFSRLGIQVSYYLFFPVLIMYIMCIVCLGYLSFLPTSAIASVLCTCISMYVHVLVLSSNLSRSGLVESKIRILISKLEYNDGIELAHVYPTAYGPPPGDK